MSTKKYHLDFLFAGLAFLAGNMTGTRRGFRDGVAVERANRQELVINRLNREIKDMKEK